MTTLSPTMDNSLIPNERQEKNKRMPHEVFIVLSMSFVANMAYW
jgi:hypothetical protein